MGILDRLTTWAEGVEKQARKQQKKQIGSPESAEDRKSLEQETIYREKAPRIKQIISESVSLIKKTKDIEVALLRFETLREMYQSLLLILPECKEVKAEIPGLVGDRRLFRDSDIDMHVDKGKQAFVTSFFRAKISEEVFKALTCPTEKTRLSQLKKASKTASVGLEHKPDDEELKNIIMSLEVLSTGR